MSAVKVWNAAARPIMRSAAHSDDRAWEEAELKDVGDQALMRGLATAFPIVRPGRFLSYCGHRPGCGHKRLTGIPIADPAWRPCAKDVCRCGDRIRLFAPPLQRPTDGQLTGDRCADPLSSCPGRSTPDIESSAGSAPSSRSLALLEMLAPNDIASSHRPWANACRSRRSRSACGERGRFLPW